MNSHLQNISVHLLAAWLVLIGPAIDALLTARLKRECDSKRRVRHYVVIIVSLWASAAAAVMCCGWNSILVAGSVVADSSSSLGSIAGRSLILIVGFSFLLLASQPLLKSIRNPKVFAAYKRITEKSTFSYLFPTSIPELRLFSALSVSAGVCEEILFRSFLTAYLHSGPIHLALPWAILIAAISFGLNHAYQGVGGMIRATIIGDIIALLFLSTGSLWLVMVIHAFLDLQVVLMLRPSIIADSVDTIVSTQIKRSH